MKMFLNKKPHVFLLSLTVFLIMGMFSCVPQKKLKYVQDKILTDTINTYSTPNKIKQHILPNDELYINVIGPEEKIYSYFNITGNISSMQSNIILISYQVSDSGYIDFPVVGKINLMNQTLEEAKITIEQALKEYVDKPSVNIKFVNRTITVIGEVRQPGKIEINKDQNNIFQILAQAGDIDYYGNRKRVAIIRKNDVITTYNYIDLTDKRIVQSEFYYLKPNDIVYVEPLRNKIWGINTIPGGFTSIFSIITSIITLTYIIKLK
jgi:polysaccharide biosynthesis/export protein